MPVATQLDYPKSDYIDEGHEIPVGWQVQDTDDGYRLVLDEGYTEPRPLYRPGGPAALAVRAEVRADANRYTQEIRQRVDAAAAAAAPPPPAPIGPGLVLPAGAPKFPGNPAEQRLPETEDPETDCVICTAKMNSRARYVGKCGHTVHLDEYANLAAHPAGNKTCPFCRKSFGGKRRKTKKIRKTRHR